MFIFDFVAETVLDQIIDWLYGKIIGFLNDFFVMMNNMGVELFDLPWVEAVTTFFGYFGWALFGVGLVVGAFECAIEYQGGRGSIKDTAMNYIKGFMAVNLFTIVPVNLYSLCVSLQGTFGSAITGIIDEELVYFLIQPSNISVLSEESLSARIYGLMTVLKGITEIEMMCLNSRENFEDNKRYLKKRMEEETNPVVRKLLEKDANYLDRMQVQMATAREFLLIIRLREKKENEIFSYLNRIEKMLAEQGFTSKRAEEEDIKRILAVYFEQNVTTEKFEEFDGERWIILNE